MNAQGIIKGDAGEIGERVSDKGCRILYDI